MSEERDASACRVGERIRFIRKTRGLSQAELGKLVGLNSDRIQKYENGMRKPKDEMLEKIAAALGVTVHALTAPVLTDEIGVMYALFELEKKFNLSITQIDGINYLSFVGDDSYKINEFLTHWHEAKLHNRFRVIQTEASSEPVNADENVPKREYYDWEWTFPNSSVVEDIERKSSISKKQAEIEKLENLLYEMKENLKRELDKNIDNELK